MNSMNARLDLVEELLDGALDVLTVAKRLADFKEDDPTARNRYHFNAESAEAVIIDAATESQRQQDKLVDLLIHVSQLPSPHDSNRTVIDYNGQDFWEDLPALGMEANHIWNSREIPLEEDALRSKGIQHFVNADAFVAKVKATGLDVFSYEMFALWTFREALAEPFQRPDEMTDHEAAIPAAATWITILGHEIYHWDKESPSGPLAGAPGRGGPLWSSKHGFCSERWDLWRSRFG